MPHAPGHGGPSLVLISGDLITLSFRRFKHSSLQGPQSLQIQGACSPGSSIYVAAFLRDFLRARGAKHALRRFEAALNILWLPD